MHLFKTMNRRLDIHISRLHLDVGCFLDIAIAYLHTKKLAYALAKDQSEDKPCKERM